MSAKITLGLVDDHTLFRKGMVELIGHLPAYEILWQAADGKELMAVMERGQVPDLVLLDIHMPKMDGYATAEWLQQHYARIKILALSMYDDELSVIRMFRSGARGYVLKDAQPEELERALDQLIHRGYYHPDFVADLLMKNAGAPLTGKTSGKPLLREQELVFLRLACSEQTYKEIADHMNLSVRTIDGYREELFDKLGVKSRTGLVLFAIRQRLVDPFTG